MKVVSLARRAQLPGQPSAARPPRASRSARPPPAGAPSQPRPGTCGGYIASCSLRASQQTRGGRHNRLIARVENGGKFVEYEFGRPAAPKETWERYAKDARDALTAELGKEDCAIDVVEAALQIACEDDAVHSRSVVKLPTQPYSKRLDTMVDEVIRIHLPKLDNPTPKEILTCVDDYLYNLAKYKLAEGWLEAFSPYRLYAHNVLAQKTGTPVGLAIVHLGLLQRLKAKNAFEGFDFEIVIPHNNKRPFARVADGGSDVGIVLTPRTAVLMVLDSLKRSYWPWEWPQGATSGFTPAAEAALGTSGRIGTVNDTTGVLQAQGRPFGDLTRTLLAVERLVLLNGPVHNMRDLGILFFHMKRYQESYQFLTKYNSVVEASVVEDGPVDVPKLKPQVGPLSPEADSQTIPGVSMEGVTDAMQKVSLEGMKAQLDTIAEEKSLVEGVLTKLERIKAESSWAL